MHYTCLINHFPHIYRIFHMRNLPVLLSLLAAALATPAHANGEINVYSYRQPFLIKPMFDAFTRETGIDVNVVYAKKGLVERIKQEGANSRADLIFTVDIGRLTDAVSAGVTQRVENAALDANPFQLNRCRLNIGILLPPISSEITAKGGSQNRLAEFLDQRRDGF